MTPLSTQSALRFAIILPTLWAAHDVGDHRRCCGRIEHGREHNIKEEMGHV